MSVGIFEKEFGTGGVQRKVATISVEHQNIHSGNSWVVQHHDTDVDAVQYYTFVTDSSADEWHIVASVDISQAGVVAMFKGPSNDSNTTLGDTVTGYCRLLSDSSTGGATLYVGTNYGDTANAQDTGTRIEIARLAGGSGPKAVGATQTQRNEWILGASSRVAFAVTPDSANAVVTFGVEWYTEAE